MSRGDSSYVLGIDYTFFAVSDIQKSISFYCDTLGIPLTRSILEDTWAEFEIYPDSNVIYTQLHFL